MGVQDNNQRPERLPFALYKNPHRCGTPHYRVVSLCVPLIVCASHPFFYFGEYEFHLVGRCLVIHYISLFLSDLAGGFFHSSPATLPKVIWFGNIHGWSWFYLFSIFVFRGACFFVFLYVGHHTWKLNGTVRYLICDFVWVTTVSFLIYSLSSS